MAASGRATREIGRTVGCTTGTASKWRVRYAAHRMAGLDETGNRGAAPKSTHATNLRILRVLDLRLPDGHGRWTGPLIANALGDVDVQQVWRVLRAQKIDLAARKSWCESNDPDFAAKAADIVGLYMAPPEAALVISIVSMVLNWITGTGKSSVTVRKESSTPPKNDGSGPVIDV